MRVNVHRDLSTLDLEQEVGRCLDTDYIALKSNWTVGETIQYIRSRPFEVKLRYFYVVNEENKLCGVISSHLLITNDGDTPLTNVMDTDPLVVKYDSKLKDTIRLLNEHRLVALPVVDDNHILKGVVEMQVSKDDFQGESQSSLHLKKSLYNDIFQLMGVSIEDHRTKSPLQGFMLRMPWLFGNLVAGLTCAAIAGYFQLVLEQTIILAMFIPLVLTLSESISMQSMTMSLNMLHSTKVKFRDVIKKVMNECKTAMLLGLTAGIVVECIAFILHRDELPLFVVAVSIFTSMIMTASFGVLFPVILHQFRLDPKIAGGPVVLMFADVCATAIYLGLATWWIL